ncbi:PHP domain-containing protein [Allostreptomyces psammosilenae]|uniref:Polymerase/histidinol phosphatase N-terminal domain-containing protein n=1 Tax=Allostreptomyces psammosilenae TaxID=1892865 RepID=A0A853A5H1_9ACTN|nr:PHP domain-containing protein [Allostreptomyces psammosilenae]NYI08104.1 hypothetical protein [Allostreptomyces psammosilenae]
MRIDLHAHTTASDGTDSPAELVRGAVAAGLDVLAITDHDTVGGWERAAEAVAELPAGTSFTLIPGAEISCRLGGVSLHLLGYLFDPVEPRFAEVRRKVRASRVHRAELIVERCRELGAPITWEQVRRIAGTGAVGRPHVASALVEAGVVPDVSAAFTAEWLADGGRAHVEKLELDPAQAIALIRGAGGVAVFAHPGAVGRGRTVTDEAIAELAAQGLAGVEVDHMDHDEETRKRLRALAGELGLLVTGSSDYHGTRKTVRLGDYLTEEGEYRQLVERAGGTSPVTR